MEDFTVRSGVYQRMVAHAYACFPEEAVGVFVGNERVFLCVPNEHPEPLKNYMIGPQMHARLLETYGSIQAVFHTHPEGPARLSTRDQRFATPGLVYVVMSLQEAPLVTVERFWEDGSNEGSWMGLRFKVVK